MWLHIKVAFTVKSPELETKRRMWWHTIQVSISPTSIDFLLVVNDIEISESIWLLVPIALLVLRIDRKSLQKGIN